MRSIPRSSKVFKKRKGTLFNGRNVTSSSNSTLDADVSNNDIKTDIKNSFAKERKIPDLNASFSTFEGNIDYHEGAKIATVNTRYVYALHSIGRVAAAGRIFCALMNLPQPPTRFAPYNKKLLNAVKLVSEETIQKAMQEAVLENGSNNNIAVAVDGTWQKRSYSPLLNGVVTVTSIDAGKVIDVEILSKYCMCSNKVSHIKDCKRNFEGSSGWMEVYNDLSLDRCEGRE
ncbi:uncharacterized protein NPIL_203481 [Nephila pilipes]|uniref:Mutator-like transposase domain-containing protein n=1 Tax=Nephila pilipes TaxID=299642 RepID=A0A8X6NAN6_NEPPI|nr:uncharacterized protein NPIL_203481 [Nephila pilipes]